MMSPYQVVIYIYNIKQKFGNPIELNIVSIQPSLKSDFAICSNIVLRKTKGPPYLTL